MVFHDSGAHYKSKPVSGRLGCETRVKDILSDLLRHPGTIVFEHNPILVLTVICSGSHPTLNHSVGGVCIQIEQHLLDLTRVNLEVRQVSVRLEYELSTSEMALALDKLNGLLVSISTCPGPLNLQ